MNNHNRVSTKKRRKRVRPQLVPSDGVRTYYSGAGVFAAAAGMIPLLVMSFIFSKLRNEAAGGFAASLPKLGCSLIAGGLLAAFATAGLRFKRSGLIAAILGMATAGGTALLLIDELLVLFEESTVLGTVQTVTMLLFLISVAVAVVAMLISAIGARIVPRLGTIMTVSLAIAGVLYAIRVMTTFSSVFSSIGKQLNWENEVLPADRKWILRSVEPDSPLAGKMFNVHLAYCVTAIFAMLLAISAITRFRQHFESFNKRLAIAVQMYRDGTVVQEPDDEYEYDDERYDDVRGIGENDGFDDDLDYYDGMETLERDRYEENEREELRRYEQESRRVHQQAAYRTAESDEYDDYEPLSNPVVEALERRRAEEERLRREEEQRREDERRREEERLMRQEELERLGNTRPAAQDERRTEPQRTASGALRVKVRTVPNPDAPKKIPDPDTDDIWNQYLE